MNAYQALKKLADINNVPGEQIDTDKYNRRKIAKEEILRLTEHYLKDVEFWKKIMDTNI